MAPPRSSQAFLRLRGPPRIRYHCANAWGSTVGENPKNLYLLGIYIGDSRYQRQRLTSYRLYIIRTPSFPPKETTIPESLVNPKTKDVVETTWRPWTLGGVTIACVTNSRSSPSMLDSAGNLYGHPLNLDLIFTHLNEQWILATKPFHIRYLCLHSNLALLVDIP